MTRFRLTDAVVFVLVIASCNVLDETSQDVYSTGAESDKLPYIDVIHADLVFDWLDDIESSEYLLSQFTVSSEPVNNIHYPEQIDTIRHYKTAKSELSMCVTPDKQLLMNANFFDSDVTLSRKIKIGVSKEEVFKVLHTRFSNDTIKIQEPLGYGVYFELYFNDDRLNQIYFYGYVD